MKSGVAGTYNAGQDSDRGALLQIDFSRPGKPTDNCFVETVNGSWPDEYQQVTLRRATSTLATCWLTESIRVK